MPSRHRPERMDPGLCSSGVSLIFNKWAGMTDRRELKMLKSFLFLLIMMSAMNAWGGVGTILFTPN